MYLGSENAQILAQKNNPQIKKNIIFYSKLFQNNIVFWLLTPDKLEIDVSLEMVNEPYWTTDWVKHRFKRDFRFSFIVNEITLFVCFSELNENIDIKIFFFYYKTWK